MLVEMYLMAQLTLLRLYAVIKLVDNRQYTPRNFISMKCLDYNP